MKRVRSSNSGEWARRVVPAVGLALGLLGVAPGVAAKPRHLERPVLISAVGKVTLELPGGNRARATALTQFDEVNEFSLGEGAEIRGICADLKRLRHTGPRSDFRPCELVEAPSAPSARAPLRASVQPTVPRVLFPRQTFVRRLERLEWSKLSDREEYTVELLDERFTALWTTRVTGASTVRYPDSAPKLIAGAVYTLRVTSGTDSSEQEPADVGFRLMSRRGQAEVTRAEALLRTLRLDKPAASFLHALLLRRYGLRGEAILELKALNQLGAGVALAETYAQVGLDDLAARELELVRGRAGAETLQLHRATQLLRELGFSASAPDAVAAPGGGGP